MSDARCPFCGSKIRVCPVCLTVFAATARRGRPRRFCSDECRWKAGHAAARERRARAAESGAWTTTDELIAMMRAQVPDFPEIA